MEWFCISYGSRLSQQLLLTLLEVSTTAHAFCTLATYFVWWSKPLNVAVPTLLREKDAQEMYALLKCSDSERAGPGQIWADLQYSPQQSNSTDCFIYCEEEQEFRGAESEEREGDLEEKATDSGITSGGYIKVHTAPCEYELAAAAAAR